MSMSSNREMAIDNLNTTRQRKYSQ